MASFIPIRYLICLMLCFIGVISILNRLNVNIAITSMVKENNSTKEHPNLCPSLSIEPPIASILQPNHTKDEGRNERFDWSPELQGIVMGSFFWTYFIFQTPSGFIAGRYGGYLPICISLIVSGGVSILSPFATHASVYLLVLLRVVLGIFQAAIYPGLFVLACSWVPLHERSTAVAFSDVSANIGNLINLFVSGFIIKAYGWKMMFWLPGALSLIAAAFVVPFLRNTPEEHKLVSKTELDLIRGRDKETVTRRESSDVSEFEESRSNQKTREAIPWRQILTSGPVWAMLIFRFGRGFVTYFLASEMPTYLGSVLHEDVVTIGVVGSISTAVHIVSALTMSKLSEVLIVRGTLSRTNSRKMFSIFSGLMSGIFLALIPILGCNRSSVRAVYAVSGFFVGCGIASDTSLPAEMSTKYHGVIYAIGNMAGNIPGFLTPMLSGAVLESVSDRWVAWRIIFFSIGGFLTFANIFFLVMASAKRQYFDLSPQDRRASRRLSSLK